MKPQLKLVGPSPKPSTAKGLDAELRALLRSEASLQRKLADVRARIAPLKREYMATHQVFGLSNAGVKRDMIMRRVQNEMKS